jgi:hypothetical protein
LAHEKLAKLLAFDGEYARSSEHLRLALQIKTPVTEGTSQDSSLSYSRGA